MNTVLIPDRATIAFDTGVLSAFGVTVEQAEKLFTASLEKDVLRKRIAVVEAEYRAALPYATKHQMDVLCEATRQEMDVPQGNKANVDFILTDAQQARMELVKAERRAELVAAKPVLVRSLLEDVSEQLVSYRVRAGAKRTTTTLRFERRHAVDKVGLMAAITGAATLEDAADDDGEQELLDREQDAGDLKPTDESV